MLEIRLLGADDAKEYYELRLEGLKKHPKSFSTSIAEWRAKEIRELEESLEKKDPVWTWGAFLEGKMVGTVTLKRNTTEKENHKAWIHAVYVSPRARGQKLGAKLVEKVIDFAEEHDDLWQLFLVVAKQNEPARKLYEKMGFQVIGVQKDSMKVGDEYVDEYIMRRELHQDHR